MTLLCIALIALIKHGMLSSRHLRDDPLIDVVPGAFIRLTDKTHFTGDICVMGICERDEICKREIKAAFICYLTFQAVEV